MLRHGILGLLNYGDMSGYQIMAVFRDSLNYFWTAQTSQIYRELQTLEERGYVTHTVVKGGSRPDSKLFSITDEGKCELLKWLGTENCFDSRSRLLMLTFFRGELSTAENIRFFRSIKESALKFGSGMNMPEGSADLYSKAIDMPERSIYWKMTVEYGKMYTKMLCDWCDSCIKMLEGEEK